MNIQVDPTRSNVASAMLNSKTRPRAVVGYGVKIFLPSPLNYVTRSPGEQWSHKIRRSKSIVGLMCSRERAQWKKCRNLKCWAIYETEKWPSHFHCVLSWKHVNPTNWPTQLTIIQNCFNCPNKCEDHLPYSIIRIQIVQNCRYQVTQLFSSTQLAVIISDDLTSFQRVVDTVRSQGQLKSFLLRCKPSSFSLPVPKVNTDITFTTFDAWHSVDGTSKATAVVPTKLRFRIGAWSVTVTHSLATCNAAFWPIGKSGVSTMNWKTSTQYCKGQPDMMCIIHNIAGVFWYFRLSISSRKDIICLPGQLCMLQDLRCKTWRLLTLIMRSLIPPPHDLSHGVNSVANTLSTKKMKRCVDVNYKSQS